MQLADELRKLLGADAVASDPETLAAHGGDKWFAAETPEVVVFARSTADVSKLLKFASREKFRSLRAARDLATSADAFRCGKESRFR